MNTTPEFRTLSLSAFNFLAEQPQARLKTNICIVFSKAHIHPLNSQEFMVEDMKISSSPNEMFLGRFRWNAQVNSFSLVDYSKMGYSPVGQSDLNFDIGCTGSSGRLILDIKPDGTCVSSNGIACQWTINDQKLDRISYLTGRRPVYQGTLSGPVISGRFTSSTPQFAGCWTAAKIQLLNRKLIGNSSDPRTGLDSSGIKR